jgi:ATP-dependent Clp protease ATP-binding subunit ClpA
MDDATLTDNDGRKADFRNVILIMTSNLGVGEGSNIGFNQEQADFKEEAIERFFAPEFINRLDSVVRFKPLNKESLFMVIDKFLEEIAHKLSKKNIKLTLTKKAKEELIKKGYNPKMGARPMARVIENEIIEPLSDEILFGKLSRGGEVKVDFNKGFKFSIK